MDNALIDSRTIPAGYFGVVLGKRNNPNQTYFRKDPKVRGKANVKAAKRARMADRMRRESTKIAA